MAVRLSHCKQTERETIPAQEHSDLQAMETPVTWQSSRWTCEGRGAAPPSLPIGTHAYRIPNSRTRHPVMCDGISVVTFLWTRCVLKCVAFRSLYWFCLEQCCSIGGTRTPTVTREKSVGYVNTTQLPDFLYPSLRSHRYNGKFIVCR
jgi:hypothetical protein